MQPSAPLVALLLSVSVAAAGCSSEAACDGDCNGSADGGASSTGTGEGVAYGTDPITIAFASYDLSCANLDPPYPDCGYWRVEVQLAASTLLAGPVDFQSAQTDSFVNSGTPGPDSCLVSATPFVGEFVIESIDAQQIVVAMANTSVTTDIPAETYLASRCP